MPVSLKIQRGFTMVELITVMIIVGILAVVALPKFFSRDTFDDRAAADQVKAAIRYGQKVAIAQRRNVTTKVSPSASSSTNCDITLVGGNVVCQISNNVTTPTKDFTFDALGRPVPNAVATAVIGSTTITVEAETGYVH